MILVRVRRMYEEVGTNEFKINKDFREVYGVNVFDFFLNAQMDQAKRFLLDSDEDMDTIAWLIGYPDGASFARAFEKYYGRTPEYYRAAPIFSHLN